MVYVRGPEVNGVCSPQLLSALYFEARLLIKPGTHSFRKPENPSDPFSDFMVLGL